MDIPNYELRKINDNLSNIFLKNKKIKISLNNVLLPFGLESYDYFSEKKYFIQAELPENDIIFLKNLEFNISDKLNIEKSFINTQIITNSKFNDKLKINIHQKKDKILTDFIDCNHKLITMFDIKKNQKYDLVMSPIVFHNHEKIILKWSLIKMKCV